MLLQVHIKITIMKCTSNLMNFNTKYRAIIYNGNLQIQSRLPYLYNKFC